MDDADLEVLLEIIDNLSGTQDLLAKRIDIVNRRFERIERRFGLAPHPTAPSNREQLAIETDKLAVARARASEQ